MTEVLYSPAMKSLSAVRDVRSKGRRRTTLAKVPNKHQEKTAQTRRALLKSARLVFARDGFEACRIEDVAAAAGRTRGAFYTHFETKAELFFALLQEEVDKHARRIRAVLEGRETVEDRLAALRDYYARCMADREWGMLVLEFKLFAARHPRLRPQLAAIHRRIRASMKLEVIYKLLGIDKTDNEPRSAALEGVMAGLFLEHVYDPERLSEQQAAVFLGHIFDSFLSARRTGD